jgi:alanine racemase
MYTAQYRTWIEVSKSTIQSNAKNVLKNVNDNIKYMGVVKGNAWGLGTVDFAKTLIEAGADWIAVTLIEDAIAIREVEPDRPILIMMEYPGKSIELALKNDIRSTVCTMEMAKQISKIAVKMDVEAKLHVKVNTGLNRIGVSLSEAETFIEEVLKLPHVTVEGAFTHFSSAAIEDKRDLTYRQLNSFLDVIAALEAKGYPKLLLHTANSPATIDIPESYLDMVRPGMSITGLYPNDSYMGRIDLQSPLSWKTIVSFVRVVEAGKTVGYGGKYHCDQDTKIVTIPVGTADGLGKRFEGKGVVLINGKRWPIMSATMDQTMLVVDKNENISLGDEVVIIGQQGDEYLGPHEISQMTSYDAEELVCQISTRIPRIYI